MQCFVFLAYRPLLARETFLSWGCKAEKSWVLAEKGRMLFCCCFVHFLEAQWISRMGCTSRGWCKQPCENPRDHGENKPFVFVTTAPSWFWCVQKGRAPSPLLFCPQSGALLFEGFYRVLENENCYFWTWLLQPHWRMTPILESIQVLF